MQTCERERKSNKMRPKFLNLKQTNRCHMKIKAAIPNLKTAGRDSHWKWAKHQPDISSELEWDCLGMYSYVVFTYICLLQGTVPRASRIIWKAR